jgi:4a-hydroxytetrahydrobiopterin dehydratase
MRPLRADEIALELERLHGWRHEDGALVKSYRFGTFVRAFAFLTSVALLAERLGHHPEVHNVFDRVVLRLRTHDAGDVVSTADVELAAAIDGIDPT